jgi:hypothetical protein
VNILWSNCAGRRAYQSTVKPMFGAAVHSCSQIPQSKSVNGLPVTVNHLCFINRQIAHIARLTAFDGGFSEEISGLSRRTSVRAIGSPPIFFKRQIGIGLDQNEVSGFVKNARAMAPCRRQMVFSVFGHYHMIQSYCAHPVSHMKDNLFLACVHNI